MFDLRLETVGLVGRGWRSLLCCSSRGCSWNFHGRAYTRPGQKKRLQTCSREVWSMVMRAAQLPNSPSSLLKIVQLKIFGRLIPAFSERFAMYSRSFSSLAFSSRLPMYSTDFLPVGLAFSIRDQSSSSSSSGAMGFTACGFSSAVLILSNLGQWRSFCAERRLIRCRL